MKLKVLEQALCVCQLPFDATVNLARPYTFAARTDDELSLVCPECDAPEFCIAKEDHWRAFFVAGTLDFSLVGILAQISAILAKAGIPVFVLSTYQTDYVLVKEERFQQALNELAESGYDIA